MRPRTRGSEIAVATDSMSEFRRKYRLYLEKILAGIDPDEPGGVEIAYARLRAANERMLAGNPGFAETGRDAELRQAVEDVIAEHSLGGPAQEDAFPPDARVPGPAGQAPESGDTSLAEADVPAEPVAGEASAARAPRRRLGAILALFGFIAGLAVAGGAVAGLVRAGMVDFATGAEASRKARWEEEYRNAVPQMEAALGLLSSVEQEVRRRQREAPAELAKLAGAKLVRLRDFDERLNAEMPEGLPAGSNVVLRADAEAYKILLSGPLCRTATIARPDRIDPKRPGDGLNCTHFGFWNGPGADF